MMKSSKASDRRQLAHDLRDPTAAIVTFASLLRSGKMGDLNDKQREFVDDILASARELLGMIDRGLGPDPDDTRAPMVRPSRLRH
jgi:signal transduction histidine kinase